MDGGCVDVDKGRGGCRFAVDDFRWGWGAFLWWERRLVVVGVRVE